MGTPRHKRIRRPVEVTLGEAAFARLELLSQAPPYEGNRSRLIDDLILRAPDPKPAKAAAR